MKPIVVKIKPPKCFGDGMKEDKCLDCVFCLDCIEKFHDKKEKRNGQN